MLNAAVAAGDHVSGDGGVFLIRACERVVRVTS